MENTAVESVVVDESKSKAEKFIKFSSKSTKFYFLFLISVIIIGAIFPSPLLTKENFWATTFFSLSGIFFAILVIGNVLYIVKMVSKKEWKLAGSLGVQLVIVFMFSAYLIINMVLAH